MLQRSERIKYSGLFTQAFQKGKRLHSTNLTLVCTVSRENLSHRFPLVGFVISKDYSKKAVARNRIKRQLREIYRHYRNDNKNYDSLKKLGLVVIKVNSKKAFDDYHLLEAELLGLFAKLKLSS